MILLLASAQLHAASADNIWQNVYGQRWFYEVRSGNNETLAGSWWESSLSPGNTYRITFNVNSLRGSMRLLVGANDPVTINRTGSHTYDFHITNGGQRRMLFRTASNNVTASVNQISVTAQSGGGDSGGSGGGWSGGGGGGGAPARGHYVSMDREHNLRTQMQNYIDRPYSASSNWHLNFARDLHNAITTPGVRGIWMQFDWRSIETGDNRFNWSVLDANMDVARQHGKKFIVKIADRSFDGGNPLPSYFPGQYRLYTSGGGNSGWTAKRWDPWVYNRLIRLHRAIAARYANHAGFGGIATAETAMGTNIGGNYSVGAYRAAITQITNQTQSALRNGARFFLYMNFLRGGDNSDMNLDQRVALLRNVSHGQLVIGGPDITPDAQGMPRSATAYRVHMRRTAPGLQQFCHFQHIDLGAGGANRKSNQYRIQYRDEVNRVRNRERQSWFNGRPAVFAFDNLADGSGNPVQLHPNWQVGQLWQPSELFQFGRQNFGCDYYFWHFRENTFNSGFRWPDIRPVIVNNQWIN